LLKGAVRGGGGWPKVEVKGTGQRWGWRWRWRGPSRVGVEGISQKGGAMGERDAREMH